MKGCALAVPNYSSPGGVGGIWFASERDDRMGQKSQPPKIPGPKINPQKIQCPISKP